jgi:hypothetical protein
MPASPRVRAPLALAVAAALGLLAGAPASAQRAEAGLRRVETRRAFAPNGMLRIWNLSGGVRVSGWDRDSILVTGTVPADQEYHCGGSLQGVKCSVDVPSREDGKVAGSQLEARVPRRAQLWIKTASADVLVTGIAGGDLDVYTVGGKIRVEGEARALNLESMGGDIEVVASSSTLRAKTASGTITVTGAADDAAASSVSGRILLSGGRFQRGRFESIEGDVRWEGAFLPAAFLEFIGHSGSTELAIPAKSSAEFTISTYQGTVQNAFGKSRLVDARDLNGKELTFAIGPRASARVAIRNFKGTIILSRKD